MLPFERPEAPLAAAAPASAPTSFYAAPHVIAAHRQQLLRGVQAAVKEALETGLEAPAPGLQTDEPSVYALCRAIERCLEHHILPPIALFEPLDERFMPVNGSPKRPGWLYLRRD